MTVTIQTIIDQIEGLSLADVRQAERELLANIEATISQDKAKYRSACRQLQVLRAVLSTFSLDALYGGQ
jgi:hypothetical protein